MLKRQKSIQLLQVSDMLAGQMFICYHSYMSLSGFFTILPHLVLTLFSPSFLCLLSDTVLMSSSLCFPLMSCILFVSLCASGIILLFGLSFVIILVVGGGGCL